MCKSYPRIKNYFVLVFAACLLLSASSALPQAYFEDFEGVVGTEWSNTSTDTAPSGPREFLGQFGNETVSLTLADYPACTVTVSFELFIIHSWDGHADGSVGPDVWDLSVDGGPTLVHTTFATHSPRLQAYPGPFVAEGDPPLNFPHTGASEINSLDFRIFLGPVTSIT